MSVKSPCIELCKFDGKTGACIGCWRTREECRQWKKMTDHRRHQILGERTRRQAKVLGSG
ncbi:DUF1289 domain-containing protein [Duganella sacchari]|uniref:DUF1289 domain-containing protein n=1 Tax=Duganella sacchari TaxID=551987 RepID=UPI000933BB41|nr:DUF1289 domain-containing protein [Duganella sacchari]